MSILGISSIMNLKSEIRHTPSSLTLMFGARMPGAEKADAKSAKL